MPADQKRPHQKIEDKSKKEETMKRFFTLCFLSIFLLSLMASPGFSQKAADILEKVIEAQGGRKVLENIKDTTMTGSLEMVQMGISGSMTIYHKEPNKMRMDGEVMGMVFTAAFDGETAWMTNPQTGSTEEMPEKEAEEFNRDALGRDSLLHPEKYGITYAYKGKEKIEDKEYHVLEQTYSDGHKTTHYIDPETYLTYKTKTTALNQMGIEVETESFMSDYKKVEGMMIPHSIITFQEGEEFMQITVTEVSFNTGLEDSLFKMSE